MIIELGIVAVVAAVGGALATRAARKKRDAAAQAVPVSSESKPDPFATLAARIGDVIQHGDATRWPSQAILVRSEGAMICAVLLSEEDGERQATVAMAPPDRCLYWLRQETVELPSTPPARLEINGCLLDRRKLLTVELETQGDDAPDLGEQARFALYQGTLGDAAVVLEGAQTHIWYGARLSPDDYDTLGQGGD